MSIHVFTRRLRFVSCLILALSAGAAAPAGLSPGAPRDVAELREIERRVRAVVTATGPATVSLHIPADFRADPGASRPSGAGSAVIVTPEGLGLTAAHVIERPGREIRVAFADGTRATARTLGVDHRLDVGLIQMVGDGPDGPGGAPWPHAPRAAAGDAGHGDWVVALGHPGGFEADRPVTARLGRVIRLRPVVGFQTDCALIGGDSGGPLFDLQGRVVGIHTRIGRTARTNVSASIDDIDAAWTGLMNGARVWEVFGAVLSAHRDGVRLHDVDPSGAAARAGLEAGDVLRSLDGVDLADPHAAGRALVFLAEQQAEKQAASGAATASVEVWRDEERRSLEVPLGHAR